MSTGEGQVKDRIWPLMLRNLHKMSEFSSHFVVFVPFENFSLIWRRHHHLWRATNFDLNPPLIDIEQWGFLTCDTYCDTDQPSIMVISEDQWNSHLVPNVGSGAVTITTCWNDLRLSRPGIEPWSPACKTNALPLSLHGDLNPYEIAPCNNVIGLTV